MVTDWLGVATDARGFRAENLPELVAPRCEIVDGSLLITPPHAVEHQCVLGRLLLALHDAAPASLRVLPGVSILRRGATDRLLVPEVAVVRAEAATGGRVTVGPEEVHLVAEVASPATRAVDLYLRRGLYAEWGIGSYWVLDPGSRRVHRFGHRPVEGSWLAGVEARVWPRT